MAVGGGTCTWAVREQGSVSRSQAHTSLEALEATSTRLIGFIELTGNPAERNREVEADDQGCDLPKGPAHARFGTPALARAQDTGHAVRKHQTSRPVGTSPLSQHAQRGHTGSDLEDGDVLITSERIRSDRPPVTSKESPNNARDQGNDTLGIQHANKIILLINEMSSLPMPKRLANSSSRIDTFFHKDLLKNVSARKNTKRDSLMALEAPLLVVGPDSAYQRWGNCSAADPHSPRRGVEHRHLVKPLTRQVCLAHHD